jgi:hypothetical protein
MTIRLAIRGYAGDTLVFRDNLVIETEQMDTLLTDIAEEHMEMIAAHQDNFTIEIEFLDEPDVNQRFFRFGSTPDRMVQPIRIHPEKIQ